jgi:signal peptidase II
MSEMSQDDQDNGLGKRLEQENELNVAVEERDQKETAQSNKGYWLVLVIALAVAVYSIDQFTKALVIQNLSSATGPHYVEVLGDLIRFVYVTNTGAAFGILPNATMFFAAIAILAIPALFFLQRYITANGWIVNVAVGLLLGGNLGNLSDRLRLGHVVDFIDGGIGTLRWYTFNVADAAFVIGVLILAGYILFFSETKTESAPPKKEDAA